MRNGNVYEYRAYVPAENGYAHRELDASAFRAAFKDLSGGDLGELLADWANGRASRTDVVECVAAIARDHRTLQESVIRFLLGVLIQYGQQNNGYDDRNEDAVRFCEALGTSLESGDLKGLGYLRYI